VGCVGLALSRWLTTRVEGVPLPCRYSRPQALGFIHLIIERWMLSAGAEPWMPNSVSLESNPDLLAHPLTFHLFQSQPTSIQNALLFLPPSHPLRSYCVQALAMARPERHKILKASASDDLDQSILRFTEAMSLPLPWDPRCRNKIQILFHLTIALVHRANDSKRPEDVTRSIIHLRYLREQSPEAST
jgi:hypothetical protein